mgnify:CR=1 FL=1
MSWYLWGKGAGQISGSDVLNVLNESFLFLSATQRLQLQYKLYKQNLEGKP